MPLHRTSGRYQIWSLHTFFPLRSIYRKDIFSRLPSCFHECQSPCFLPTMNCIIVMKFSELLLYCVSQLLVMTNALSEVSWRSSLSSDQKSWPKTGSVIPSFKYFLTNKVCLVIKHPLRSHHSQGLRKYKYLRFSIPIVSFCEDTFHFSNFWKCEEIIVSTWRARTSHWYWLLEDSCSSVKTCFWLANAFGTKMSKWSFLGNLAYNTNPHVSKLTLDLRWLYADQTSLCPPLRPCVPCLLEILNPSSPHQQSAGLTVKIADTWVSHRPQN